MNLLAKALLWILYSSFIATAMTIFILVIKKILKNYLSPRFQYVLWFLILIRLLIPFSIGDSLDLINIISERYKNIVDYETTDLTQLSSHSSESNYNSKKDSREYLTDNISTLNNARNKNNIEEMYEENTLKNIFLKIEKLVYDFKEKEKDSIEKVIKISSYVWISGFISITIFVFLSTLKFKKSTSTFDKVTDPQINRILEVCKEKLELTKDISIYCSTNFKSPFIYGILNTKVYIPKYVLSIANSKDLFYIVLHELAHYKRKDLLCNLLSIIALAIHWFNPVIWFVMKRMREDRELACDNYILEVLEEHESIQYGMTILSLSKAFLNSDYKDNFSLCFYENKTQIERRVMMIKRFKKGSYRMSAVSIAVLTLLGWVTLASAEGNKLISNIDTYISQSVTSEDEGSLKLYSPNDTLVFNTLDRAKDFVDFEFNVPNYLPSEYKLSRLVLGKKKENIIYFDFIKYSVDYLNDFKNTPSGLNDYFKLLVSKENIIENLRSENKSENDKDRGYNAVVDFREEPMTISNIKGTNVTIKSNINVTKSRIQVADMKTNEVIRDREILPESKKSEFMEKYFIWNSEDIWYAIRYYNKIDDISMSYTKVDQISKIDIEQMLLSFKSFKDVSWKNHIAESSNDKSPYFLNSNLIIYDKKDLKEAERLLGFAPKFTVSLPGGFTPMSSRVDPLDIQLVRDNTNDENRNITTIYHHKDKPSSPFSPLEIRHRQGKKIFAFDSNGIDVVNEEGKSNAKTLVINDIKVLTYKYESATPMFTFYLWKQDGVFNELQLTGSIDNHEEIIKAFMN